MPLVSAMLSIKEPASRYTLLSLLAMIDETARAVLAVRKENEGMTVDDRRILVKAAVSKIARLRDGLQVVYSSIKDRRFALMSVGRW